MITISLYQRYLPHALNTKFFACKLYRTDAGVSFVCRRYKISKASLMRWNARLDGTKESLIDKSHRTLSKHPTSHTDVETKWIANYMRRLPNISLLELYGNLRTQRGYIRHPASLYRYMCKLDYFASRVKVSTNYTPKHYDTPKEIGIKWQLDVKYVPKQCYTGSVPEKFYQYTVIDKAIRERLIYPYKEQSGYSTVEFIKHAFIYFGYKSQIIQTDNGAEFTHIRKTSNIHLFDYFLSEHNIKHQLIIPRIPRHNGKVERSHRNDQERFYYHLHFYSYDDLTHQMKTYLKRYNNIPVFVFNWNSPIQQRQQLTLPK